MTDMTSEMSLQESCRDAARHMSVEVHLLTGKVDELEADNAKLRELATDACKMLRNHYDHGWFDDTIFAERMRELGIEVG